VPLASSGDLPERLKAALADRYQVQREIGSGGMAPVYLAEDLKHHRKVAVKVLNPALSAVVGTDRFLAEIRTTANLSHPHILPLHDSGVVDGFLFYVLPYVEGDSFRVRMDRRANSRWRRRSRGPDGPMTCFLRLLGRTTRTMQ